MAGNPGSRRIGRREFLSLAAGGTALGLLAGCQPQTAAPAASAPAAPAASAPAAAAPAAAVAKVLRVGVEGPFTGPIARTGDEFKAAVKEAFEAIDYKIGDYAVELVWIDDQSDVEKGTQAYEQAVVQNNITCGIINWQSSIALALMEITAKHKVPHFFGFGGTALINEKFNGDRTKYGYWATKGWPDPTKLTIGYSIAFEDAIKKGIWTPAEKTVCLNASEDDWGRTWLQAVKSQFTAVGWKVLDEDYISSGTSDFYPLLNRYKAHDPAAVVGTHGHPATVAAFIKQYDEVGLKKPLVYDGLGWVGEFYSLTGKASDYVFDMTPAFSRENAIAWAANYTKKYGFTPSFNAGGLCYDCTNFFIKVARRTLEKHGELTRETLYKIAQEELWTGKLTYTAEEGAITMKEWKYQDDTIPDPIVGPDNFLFPVVQYHEGVAKTIWPDDQKQTEFQLRP
jgi:branched-chain amino acid transport system substrate-binding protein